MTRIEFLRQLRAKIDLDNTKWMNPYTTNCYAYALGLDIPEDNIMECAFCPGTISESPILLYEYEFFSYSQLIESLYSDLEALGIDFREVSSSEIIPCDEWKIALFTTSSSNKEKDNFEDYHFLRLCKDGVWHHKNGWNSYPTIYDDNGSIIKNPEQCFLRDRNFNTCLSLKYKKNY